jgi:hypothetical protein
MKCTIIAWEAATGSAQILIKGSPVQEFAKVTAHVSLAMHEMLMVNAWNSLAAQGTSLQKHLSSAEENAKITRESLFLAFDL